MTEAKSVGVVLNNIPDEEEDLSPIITTQRSPKPRRHTVTVTINNDNYNLVGKNSDFILYLDKLKTKTKWAIRCYSLVDKGFCRS